MAADEFDEVEDKTIIATSVPNVKKAKRETAYLIVLAGNNVGEMYKIDSESVMGRGQQTQIRILDNGISRQHAKVVYRDGEVFVEDLRSTNGTFVNGESLNGARPLKDGDKIQLGSTTILKFTYHDQLEEEFHEQMYESALRDPLTKAFNRKYFLDRLNTEFAYMVRHGEPLALMIFDADHFKRVNDTFGHLAGDYVLVTLAKGIERAIRNEDVFARYGGEEFVLLCRNTAKDKAAALADRIRGAVERYEFRYEGNAIPVTVSVGLACAPHVEVTEAQDLIARADEALYKAKEGGRNKVVIAGELTSAQAK